MWNKFLCWWLGHDSSGMVHITGKGTKIYHTHQCKRCGRIYELIDNLAK